MFALELLLGLIAACVALALVARRLEVPLAVLLVLGGIGLAFLPGLRPIRLEPELAMALFLPPLLQLSAYRTDWPAFRSNLRPILLLAVGAVFFTAAAVASVAHWLVPALPWGAAIALGAIVAPPDAVAAAAVLRDLKPPKRLAIVLEGESLLNDASSLVLYRFAVGATLAGSFDFGNGLMLFVAASAGGGMVGWLVGRAAMWVFARLRDTLLDITVGILACYAAYFAGEALHVSGVLSAVMCGLVLGRHQHHEFTARTRLEQAAVWSFLEFVLTGLIFILIGLQLRGIGARLADYDHARLAVLAGAVALALIVSRFVWLFAAGGVAQAIHRIRPLAIAPLPGRQLAVLSWAGMRGVVSLAAALALPNKFPGRDIILLLAFCAILATLVVQGTTLGPLIRRLGVTEPVSEGPAADQVAARRDLAVAALSVVEERLEDSDHAEVAETIVEEFKVRVEQIERLEEDCGTDADRLGDQLRLRLAAIEASRGTLRDKRDEYEDETVRSLSAELDLEEEQIRRELGER